MSKSFASKKKDNSVLEKENEKEMEKLNKLRMKNGDEEPEHLTSGLPCTILHSSFLILNL